MFTLRREGPITITTPSGPATRSWRGRLVVLLGVVLLALNLRIAVASVSPILDTVRRDVPLTPEQVGLLGTIPVVSFALFGAVTPAVARRLGLEPTAVVALLVAVLGEVLRASSTTAPGFLAWSVVALAGMGVGNVLLPPVVKRYFPDRIGSVTAVYSVVLAVSTAAPPFLAVPVTEQAGWRLSLASWGALGVAGAVVWGVVVLRSRRARASLAPILEHAPAAGERLASRHRAGGRVWRSPLAWAMAVSFAMNSLISYVLFAWLPQLLTDAGVSAGAAGGWLGYVALVGLVPALVAPPLGARMRNPYPLVVGFVTCFLVGLAGLLLDPAGATWLWSTLVGVGVGTFPLLLALINLRPRTSAGAASLSGFTQGVGYSVAGGGPLLVGVLYGRTGEWVAPGALLAGACVVLLLAAVVACRPRYLEDTWGPRRADTLDR